MAKLTAANPTANLAALIRDGGFLTRARVAAWAGMMAAGFAVALLLLGAAAHGASDYAGRPLGTDFSNVYAAGRAALAGDAAAPFDILRQQKAEQAIFGPATPLYGWHYPPYFLLAAAALARLPYLPALLVWQGASLLLYLLSLRLLLLKSAAPQLARDRLFLPVALGFTAVFVNLTHGQNGFLTAALFAGGLALLDTRPVLAGLLFGLLAYKPQFAAVVPLALAATGRWRALLSGSATVLVLTLAVTLIFGAAVWPAFLASMHFTRTVVLEQGSTGFHKMQSVFALVRLWRGPVALAYLIQALAAGAGLFALLRIWRSDLAAGYKGAALCLCALLLTPYCLDYDLVLLAPAIALLAAEGRARGFAPFEIAALAGLWLLPIAARAIAAFLFLPLAAPAMMALLWLIYRRCDAAGPAVLAGMKSPT
ncbi:MAG TPA: glycosyltransferase family 87 protein [Rhizomicrobium sp.]|nr:glycosyltransferase family 87 protein [Rhizomicrobium sp.]